VEYINVWWLLQTEWRRSKMSCRTKQTREHHKLLCLSSGSGLNSSVQWRHTLCRKHIHMYIRCIYGIFSREITIHTSYTVYVYGSGQPYVCSILEGKGDWPVCHWLTCQCGKQGKRGSAPCHSQRRTKWAEAKADLDTTAWTKACMMRPGWWICIAGGLVHAAVDICLFTKEARMKLLLGCMNKGRNTLNVLHSQCIPGLHEQRTQHSQCIAHIDLLILCQHRPVCVCLLLRLCTFQNWIQNKLISWHYQTGYKGVHTD
jgi:hypothetical protein